MKKFFAAVLLALMVIPAEAQPVNDQPTAFDMVMFAGSDYELNLTHVDANGAAINLTGSTFAAQFRSGPYPTGTLFATYSTPVVSAVGGTSRVKLSKAQTNALVGRTGVWDLLWTQASGKATFLYSGKAMVKPTVSR